MCGCLCHCVIVYTQCDSHTQSHTRTQTPSSLCDCTTLTQPPSLCPYADRVDTHTIRTRTVLHSTHRVRLCDCLCRSIIVSVCTRTVTVYLSLRHCDHCVSAYSHRHRDPNHCATVRLSLSLFRCVILYARSGSDVCISVNESRNLNGQTQSAHSSTTHCVTVSVALPYCVHMQSQCFLSCNPAFKHAACRTDGEESGLFEENRRMERHRVDGVAFRETLAR